MKKQGGMPRSGDRNDPDIANMDAPLQAERDKKNRESNRTADRADERSTRNSEAESPGSD